MSTTASSLPILDTLYTLRDGLSKNDAVARVQAVELCRELQAELQAPAETLMKTVWAEPTHHWVLYAAQDLKIFNFLSENGEIPKTITQIVERTESEPYLIGRLMRHMAAMHSVAEVGPDTFALNKFSRYLLTPPGDSTLTFMRWFQHVEAKAPEYLAAQKYKSPSDGKKAAFTWVYGLGEMSFFEFLAKEPKYGAAFGAMMQAIGEEQPTWSDGHLYPVKQKLSGVNDPIDVLVVDIGAGTGHDLMKFRMNQPELKGRLIVQDLPYITDSLQLEGIEVMTHNFYDEQPVKGAKVYFLHHITHDYDDETCVKILRAIIPAMKPGYSRLLINDLIVPAQGAHWFTTALDFELMLSLCARERTEAQFHKLIESVGHGLKVEKIWTPKMGEMSDSIVECVIDL